MRRAEPGQLAKEAQARWLAQNGGEEAIKRRMMAQHTPSVGYLDELAARWQEAMLSRGTTRLRAAIENERTRQLHRARRLMRLAIFVLCLEIGGALAVIVWFGILGNH